MLPGSVLVIHGVFIGEHYASRSEKRVFTAVGLWIVGSGAVVMGTFYRE